jgi:hypothetical protein
MTAQRAVPRETVDTYLPANRLGMTHQRGYKRMPLWPHQSNGTGLADDLELGRMPG